MTTIAFPYPDFVHPSEAEHCQAPGCRRTADDDGPRDAITGTDLCAVHTSRFPRILGDLSRMWPDLNRALYKRPQTMLKDPHLEPRRHATGVKDIAQIWNPWVSDTMGNIRDWTQSVVHAVLTDHPLPPPAVRTSERTDTRYRAGRDGDAQRITIRTTDVYVDSREHRLTERTDTRLALAVLSMHYGRWLAGYPDLGPSWLSDALELRGKGLQALGADPVRRVGLKSAFCGEVVGMLGDTDLTCMAPMVAILTPEDRPSTLVCSQFPTSHTQYTPDQWMAWHGQE